MKNLSNFRYRSFFVPMLTNSVFCPQKELKPEKLSASSTKGDFERILCFSVISFLEENNPDSLRNFLLQSKLYSFSFPKAIGFTTKKEAISIPDTPFACTFALRLPEIDIKLRVFRNEKCVCKITQNSIDFFQNMEEKQYEYFDNIYTILKDIVSEYLSN